MGKGPESATNTSCYVQVLGVGTDTGCTVPSALLFFDRQRYLFNVGEGFQRFCVEHKIKLTKISSILATRVTTEATGGLPGMLLTMADTTAGGLLSGHAQLTLHGPPGLHTLVNGFRTFVNVKDLGLKVSEFGTGATKKPNKRAPPEVPKALQENASKSGVTEKEFSDLPECEIVEYPAVKNDSVSITPIVLRPSKLKSRNEDIREPKTKRAKIDANGSINTDNDSGQNHVSAMDVTSVDIESAVACYACELPDIPGKFLPQKAASLGVPRGPLYGKLTRGEEVTAVNGRTVKPEDVMEPSTPGPIVLVIDCPSEAFLPSLANEESGVAFWSSDPTKKNKVACVIHLTPEEVASHPEYKKFLESFGDKVQHIIVAKSIDSLIPIMYKSTALQARLNAIDPNLFPPGDALHNYRGATSASVQKTIFDMENCHVGKNMLKYQLRPLAKRGFNDQECGKPLDILVEHKTLTEERPKAITAATKAQQITVDSEKSAGKDIPLAVLNASPDDFILTFLGTGAAIPSKYRNVTGMLIDRPLQNAAFLMDCGEGSLGQLRRRLGIEGTNDVLRRLAFVWISHIHADHHVGLPTLLAARTRLLGPSCSPVVVIGPRPLRRSLISCASLEPMRFRFIDCSYTEKSMKSENSNGVSNGTLPEDQEIVEVLERIQKQSGLRRLESIRVIHCAQSFGLLLESDSEFPWKVVYSGDTRPCPSLIEASKDATLLIHEATFDDTMQEEAEIKRHCTTKEAVESGASAGAYRTILTHFSQRYPKVPVINEHFQDHVSIAFDLMSVRLTDLPRLPALVPAFKDLFDDESEEGAEAEPVPAMLT